MTALLVCPNCGYAYIGAKTRCDQELRAAGPFASQPPPWRSAHIEATADGYLYRCNAELVATIADLEAPPTP